MRFVDWLHRTRHGATVTQWLFAAALSGAEGIAFAFPSRTIFLRGDATLVARPAHPSVT